VGHAMNAAKRVGLLSIASSVGQSDRVGPHKKNDRQAGFEKCFTNETKGEGSH